jgi:hypothetical protein
MKMILAAALVIASAGYAAAQINQSPDRTTYQFKGATGTMRMQFDRGERRPDGTTYVQGFTLTFGDIVVTADDATFENNAIRLGANSRVSLPAR